MRSYKTAGIVIGRLNFGEADRILTIYTAKQGKIKALAKGVRKIRSKKAAACQLLNQAQFLLHASKELDIVREADLISPYGAIKKNLTLAPYGFYAAEVVDKLTPVGVTNQLAFNILVDFLENLSAASGETAKLLTCALQVKMLRVFGFAGDFEVFPSIRLQLNWLGQAPFGQIAKILQVPSNLQQLNQIVLTGIEEIVENQLATPKLIKHLESVM